MADHELTAVQRNEVLRAVQVARLRPADFTWEEVHTAVTRLGLGSNAYYVQALVHVPTGSAFAFDMNANDPRLGHYAILHPGRQGPTETVNTGAWENQISLVRTWLDLVKREHEAPDLWSEVARERELAGATGPAMGAAGDTLFTSEERQVIAVQLREIRELIVGAAALNAAQIAELDERIQYVEAASHRLTRRDWAGILLSTIFSFAIEHALGSALVTEVLRLAAHGLGHLFGTGGFPELPGGPPTVM